MNHRQRFLALQSVLETYDTLWRPAPFHVRRPDWCEQWPELADAVSALDDLTLDTFADDPSVCRAWLGDRLPVVKALERLCDVPRLAARSVPACDAHLDWSIPGRKREQIEAFIAHGPEVRVPLLEWCAGKGHLGRRVALADRVRVTSVEIDPVLGAAAQRLAARACVDQTVLHADALLVSTRARVRGHAVLALHACGELHRTLVRDAASAGAHCYHIAPCCYDRGASDGYRPLSRDAALSLDAGVLRLAVTETVTAPRHDRQRLARAQTWKLGFIALRNTIEGEAIRPFRPIPSNWVSGTFSACCQALAQREGVRLPQSIDWRYWQAIGERRRGEVRRFELVRHAFRRALETWLVMDLVLALEEAGFEVQVGTFCDRSLTPRNLMVVARRCPEGNGAAASDPSGP